MFCKRISFFVPVNLDGIILLAVHHFDINVDDGPCSAVKRYRNIVVQVGNLVAIVVNNRFIVLRYLDMLDLCGVLLQHADYLETQHLADFVRCVWRWRRRTHGVIGPANHFDRCRMGRETPEFFGYRNFNFNYSSFNLFCGAKTH